VPQGVRVRVSPPAQILLHLMLIQEFISKEISAEVNEVSFSWESPSNIALVKYWGKNLDQTPKNPSISFTLSNCKTTTSVLFKKIKNTSKIIDFELFFEGERNISFRTKIEKFFSTIVAYCPFLSNYHLTISSSNSFPHSSGIASSASAMSALSLCIMSLEKELTLIDDEFFYKKASFISRIGSGSACRSIYGGINFWGTHSDFSFGSDLYSTQISKSISSKFHNYRDAILIIDEGKKEVSSSVGHELMNDNPFSQIRFKLAKNNISNLMRILESGNLNEFCNLVESEALMLHSLMMSSTPSYVLMKPATLSVINLIREFRKDSNIPVCFTLDAGANVHILFPENFSQEVINFIKKKLSVFCVKQKYILDFMGKGPKQI
tara:strand:+ start:3865 stop:5001 length:1137 start_codon:yes stop_codon:yes gene_type:complete